MLNCVVISHRASDILKLDLIPLLNNEGINGDYYKKVAESSTNGDNGGGLAHKLKDNNKL